MKGWLTSTKMSLSILVRTLSLTGETKGTDGGIQKEIQHCGQTILVLFYAEMAKTTVALPFKDAFFRTFIAYNWPASGPTIFLTRNTWQKENERILDRYKRRHKQTTRLVSRVPSPCRKSPGRGLLAVRTETDRLSRSPLLHGGW